MNEEKTISLIVDAESAEDRLDVYLSDNLQDTTRSHAQRLIFEQQVTVDGLTVTKASRSVKTGENIVVTVPKALPTTILPQNIPINIVYEDECLAVINKRQGMTVHPACGNYTDTLVNALLYQITDLSGINGVMRPGIVHRLDKDTSGLMMVAKNDFAHQSLAKQIQDKTCKRIYVALLEGVVKEDSGIVDKAIARSKVDRKKMAIDSSGRSAVTLYKVLRRYRNYTLCEFELKTGRTHQIRVHAKFLGHPVVGDKTYGFKNQKFNLVGQLLHAKRIEFVHPYTQQLMTFECDIPEYFQKVLNILD